MKESPIYPRYEGGDYGFDLQVDFSQFLEEARKHEREENFEVAAQNPEGAHKKQSSDEKRKRKSWNRSFFSWLKADKKSNTGTETLTNSHISKSRGSRVSASGPIYGSGGGGEATCKPHRPTSGPLASLFQPTKRVEDEIPYMCLGKLNNNPRDVQSYGPVYLVT